MSRPLRFDPIDEAARRWEARGYGVTDAMAAATSIMRAQQLIVSTVDDALKPFDLTFARYEALVLLSFTRSGGLPMGKIGERLMVHPTSVTNTIDRLEQQGLVRRVPHPTDRRTVIAEITDEGRRVQAEATEAIVATSFGLEELSDGDLAALTRVIRKLRKRHGDFV